VRKWRLSNRSFFLSYELISYKLACWAFVLVKQTIKWSCLSKYDPNLFLIIPCNMQLIYFSLLFSDRALIVTFLLILPMMKASSLAANNSLCLSYYVHLHYWFLFLLLLLLTGCRFLCCESSHERRRVYTWFLLVSLHVCFRSFFYLMIFVSFSFVGVRERLKVLYSLMIVNECFRSGDQCFCDYYSRPSYTSMGCYIRPGNFCLSWFSDFVFKSFDA
jgi:hypothetical protein